MNRTHEDDVTERYQGRMTFAEYEELAGATAMYPDRGTGALVYPVLGLNGEAGEVAEKLKKIIRDGTGLGTEQRAALVKELGDVLWYLAACCHELGVSMDDIAQHNIEKLHDRAQRKVLSGSGDER